MIANHGKIPVWNLIAGDRVIFDGQVVTVNSEPIVDLGMAYVEFLVLEILPDEFEVTGSGSWLVTPRVFAENLNASLELPLIQTEALELRQE